MCISHRSFPWLNVLILVSLLLTLIPAPALSDVLIPSIMLRSALLLPAIPDSWAAAHSSPGETAVTNSTPSLAALLPWWTIDSRFQLNDSTSDSSSLSGSEDVPDGYTAHLWAGTSNAGVWYHDGITWTQRSNGIGNVEVKNVRLNPFDDNVLLAVTPNGVYRTDNSGANWEKVQMPYGEDAEKEWRYVYWDRSRPGVVFATGPYLVLPDSEGPRAAYSRDGGRSWTRIDLETSECGYLCSWPTSGNIWGNGSHWYIMGILGSIHEGMSKAFWRSIDGGETWERNKVDGIESDNAGRFVTGRDENPTYLYVTAHSGIPVQVRRSRDAGQTWEGNDATIGGANDLLYDYWRPGGRLWLAASSDLYLSDDNGNTFTSVYHIWPRGMNAVTVDGFTGRVYAGTTKRGVAYSDNSGDTWKDMPIPKISGVTDDNSHISTLTAPRPTPTILPDDQCNSPDPECGLNGACAANQNWLGGEINTASGNHVYSVTDIQVATAGEALRFERIYASQTVSRSVAGLGYGWTHNYAMRLTLPSIGPIIYVDGAEGADGPVCGTGKGSTACRTISYTLNYQAEYGDVVLVAPGTYRETIRLEPGVTVQGSGTKVTFIDGEGVDGPLVVASGSAITANAVISGFTITGGNNPGGDGGGVFVEDGASPTIVNNVIERNAAGSGGGLHFDGGTARLINTVVANNEAADEGGGLYLASGKGVLLHNTFYSNTAETGDGDGISVGGGTLGLTNTIVANHAGGCGVYLDSGTAILSHNDVWGNDENYCGVEKGPGDISYDPLLVDPDGGDYHLQARLQARSPCIDAGVETGVMEDFEGDPRPRISGVDIGVDEYVPRMYLPLIMHNFSGDSNAGGAIVEGESDVEPDALILEAPDGSRLRFWPNGALDPYPGVRAQVRWEEGDSNYVVTGSDQHIYRFDDEGRMLEQRDPRGNVIRFTYDPDCRLVSACEPVSQRCLTFDRDGEGRITEVRDPLHRTVQFGYDETTGDLAHATDTRGHTWSYTYVDDSHLLYEVRDPLDHLVERTEYDDKGRAVRQTTEAGDVLALRYDSFADTTVYTDANGYAREDIYLGGVWAVQTDPLNGPAWRAYDANFGLTQIVDRNGNPTQMEWNGCGCTVDEVTDALGQTTEMAYDTLNHLTVYTDAARHATYYEYEGNLAVVITDALDGRVINTYDGQNRLIQTVDHGVTTTYSYDDLGQRIRMQDAGGRITNYGYDGVGRLITTTQHANTQHAIRNINEYDDADHLVRVTRNYTMSTDERNYLGIYNLVTEYRYDEVGNRTHVTDTLGRVTRSWYDGANRLIQTTVNYTTTHTGHGPGNDWNVATMYGYDGMGRLVATTVAPGTPLEQITVNEYDPPGNLIRVTRNYTTTTGKQNYLDAYNRITRYEYDAVGNQILMTDTLGHVTRSWYDALNRPISVTQNYSPTIYPGHGLDEAWNLTTWYGYDVVGNQILVTDTLGHVTRSWYDALNRLIESTRNYSPTVGANYQNEWNVSTWYGYDARGNQAWVTDALGHLTFTEYDALNRPVTVTTNYVDGIYDPVRPDEDLIRVTTYDVAGRVLEVTDHGSPLRVTHYEYDELGRQTAVIQNYQDGIYDSERPDQDLTSLTIYNEAGQAAARVQAAGSHVTTTYEYDALGRLVTTTNALSGTSVTRYDALGRRTETIDAEGQVTGYEHDAAGRLVKQRIAGQQRITRYAYDPLDRRVAATDALTHTTVYTYDAAGRQSRTRDAEGNVTTFAYDALGRRTMTTDADGVTVYSIYDALGRLVETRDELDNRTRYSYDALGSRVAMTNARGYATRYEYDGVGRLIAVIENRRVGESADQQTNVRTEYEYDASGNLRVVTDALGHTTVYTYDLAGRRVAEEDGAGNVTGYEYDGHGRRVKEIYLDASGPITVTTAHNALGWPTQIEYPAVGDVPGFTVEYSYDALGHRDTVTDSTGTIIYDYDALYQPLAIDAPTGEAQYLYDAAGRRTHLVYPDGDKMVTYTHDAANRLRTVTDWEDGTTVYTYTPAGRLSEMRLPNSVETYYGYDAAGRLVEIEHRREGELLARYEYELDGVGNRTRVLEALAPPAAVFFDDGESGPGAWVAEGNWALSDEQAHSGRFAWHDSPGGDYVHGSNDSLTLAQPVALPADRPARLEFWDPLDLGKGDHAYVEISLDGGQSWEILLDQTEVTNVAWTRRVVSLAAYAGQSILLRFRLDARENEQVGDGWYIDDVLITTAPENVYPLPFADDAETTANWVAEGEWGLTTSAPYQGAASFADSPERDYLPQSNASLELDGLLDLTWTFAPRLTFFERYDLAQGDEAYVEVSVDDRQTWTPLLRHRRGDQPGWQRQILDLSPYTGQLLRLRFRLETGGDKHVADGWDVDVITVGEAPSPPFVPPTLGGFVVLGREGVWLKQHSQVISGHVGANVASDGPYLHTEHEVVVEQKAQILDPAAGVYGDSLSLAKNAQVYDVFYNELEGEGAVLGEHHTPLPLPLVDQWPEAPAFTPGDEDLDVAQGETLRLDPGSYGDLLARNGSAITLTGGVYDFQSWDIRTHTRVAIEAPTEIRIAGRLRTDAHVRLGPVGGLDAADLAIYVTGQNGQNGDVADNPKAVELGQQNEATANVYALNGTLLVGQNTQATGAFLGRWVVVEQWASLVGESALASPLPAPPVTLTLAGPDAAALTEVVTYTVAFTPVAALAVAELGAAGPPEEWGIEYVAPPSFRPGFRVLTTTPAAPLENGVLRWSEEELAGHDRLTVVAQHGDDPCSRFAPAGSLATHRARVYALDAPGAPLPSATQNTLVDEPCCFYSFLPLVMRNARAALLPTRVVTYVYDPLDRLVEANYSTGEKFEYVYDAVGNRKTLTSTTPLSGTLVTTYTHDAANRLTDRAVSDGRVYSYTWSARGQMLAEWTQGYPVRTFTYDGAGQMVEATVFTLTTRFTYNGLGARVAVEVVGQGATTYTLDYAAGNRILAETTDANSTLYLYGRDCLGELRDDEWLYYLSDAEGLVRQGVDGQGEVVSNWLFDPDGTVLEGPEGPVSHLVCGGVYDWSTGLIYKDGRYFDPLLGIWLALVPLVVVQSWQGRKRRRRGFLWVWLLLLGVCVGGALTACCPPEETPVPTPTPIVCTDMSEAPAPDMRFLEHTVAIETKSSTKGNVKGLGTIIRGGDTVLTHNHYHEAHKLDYETYWTAVDEVVFTSQGNEIPVKMEGIQRSFGKNQETLLLDLPPGTNLGGTPATLGDPNTLCNCDWVHVVYKRDDSQLDVQVAQIFFVGEYAPTIPMAVVNRLSKTVIDEGDSGGGMFRQGELMGNTYKSGTLNEWGGAYFMSALIPDGLR